MQSVFLGGFVNRPAADGESDGFSDKSNSSQAVSWYCEIAPYGPGEVEQ